LGERVKDSPAMRGEADVATTRYCPRAFSANLLSVALLACQPPAALPHESASVIAASPVAAVSGARVVQDELALSAGARLPPAELECVMGPDRPKRQSGRRASSRFHVPGLHRDTVHARAVSRPRIPQPCRAQCAYRLPYQLRHRASARRAALRRYPHAIQIAARIPSARNGSVEVRAVRQISKG